VPRAGTRQNKFLKIKKNCRVPSVRHSAKSDGRWPPSRAGHLLLSGTSAECRGTRQSPALPRARLCRVPGTQQSHLCRVLYFAECGTRQNIALPSASIKSTRQSLRHLAKYSFTVVFPLLFCFSLFLHCFCILHINWLLRGQEQIPCVCRATLLSD